MAMGLLQAGVDRAVVALWLGHKSVEITQIYLEANLAMKQEVLAKTTPPGGKSGRYKPGDKLLAFLKNLCPDYAGRLQERKCRNPTLTGISPIRFRAARNSPEPGIQRPRTCLAAA